MTLTVNVAVGHPNGGELISAHAIVDTGAEHSLLPTSLISQLGIPVLDRRMVMGVGGITEMEISSARFAIDREERICPVFVSPGHLCLIGASTLAQFNLVVDLANQRLIYGEELDKEYDVFLTHASEDKDDLVRPLAHKLKNEGLKVWYDEFEIRMGDSIVEKVDCGIANSRAGVIVFSPAMMGKPWPRHEINGMVSRMIDGEYKLLPIWHRVSKSEVSRFSPSLADRKAGDTSTKSIQLIAQDVASVIRVQAVPSNQN